MKNHSYFLVLVLVGILFFVFALAAPVFAIGIKTSSSGCKAVNDNLNKPTILKVDDNGKVVVVATNYSFDANDLISLQVTAIDNNGQALQVTASFVVSSSGPETTIEPPWIVKTSGNYNLSIKITLADTTNLKSITYKLSCDSAYSRGILNQPQPVVPLSGAPLPTTTP
jgi:hypothetical protein